MKYPSTSRGFTIVELLIVVIIIAILAAVTIVAYNGITARSKTAALQSDVSQIEKSVAIKEAEGGEAVPD